MNKVFDSDLIPHYINKYALHEFLTPDITPHIQLHVFEKHEHICRDNEPLDYLLLLVKGKAKVYCTLSNGKSLLLSFYRPLNTLGDIELSSENTLTANVQALEDVHCLAIPRYMVEQHLMNCPLFLRYLCASLGKKLNRLSINSSINTLYQVENRLASYLLATVVEDTSTCSEPFVFKENLTHVAELLGTSYRHLLRTISHMCQTQILKKQDNHYIIHDMKSLAALATDLYN
ncbi:MAG TPA: hypothetical protein DCY20_05845 [Firmicutes bacterium]|nr:hypothetical protein [Bacillota bacterium]